MSLKDKLMEDMKDSMRAKDDIKKNTVQMVRAGVLQVEKDNKIKLDDEGVIQVIAKELKKRRDVLPEYEKSKRDDLVVVLQKEIDILMEYLPSQLTEEELDAIVKQAVEETEATSLKDMGKVMSAVMPKVTGRADGKVINALVKKHLS